MVQVGEVQELDCGGCRKKTSHVFTEGNTEYNGKVEITQGWRCTSCLHFVEVRKWSEPEAKK